MLKQVFKLLPAQYKSFYDGELVISSDEQTTLQLNLESLAVTVNGSTVINKGEYTVEIYNKYLETSVIDDMFTSENVDSIATIEEIRALFD